VDLFLIRRPVSEATRLSGWLSWAFGVAERDAYGRRYPFDYDRRHAVNLVGTWRVTRTLDLGVTARWASGFPYTPARGVRAVAVEDSQDPGDSPRLVPDRDDEGNLIWEIDPGGVGNLNSARLPDFARVDARMSWRPGGPGGRWLFYLEVINLLNRENADSFDYDIRFDEVGEPYISSTQRQGGVPLLPTFGVRFRF
jgi:hypothetical protein